MTEQRSTNTTQGETMGRDQVPSEAGDRIRRSAIPNRTGR